MNMSVVYMTLCLTARDYPFRTYTELSEKLTFLPLPPPRPLHEYLRLRIRRLEILVFPEMLPF